MIDFQKDESWSLFGILVLCLLFEKPEKGNTYSGNLYFKDFANEWARNSGVENKNES